MIVNDELQQKFNITTYRTSRKSSERGVTLEYVNESFPKLNLNQNASFVILFIFQNSLLCQFIQTIPRKILSIIHATNKTST